jgi:hypothetical protein
MATVTLEEIQLETNQTQKFRPFGLCAGESRVPDDFDTPLPEEIIEQFEGK